MRWFTTPPFGLSPSTLRPRPARVRALLVVCAAWVGLGVLPGLAQAATPTELLAAYSQQAGMAGQPAKGQAFFNSRQGREWSCASCHGAVPTQNGRHASTGKAIQPLAPAFNPARFTDAAKADKWFRRNCNDVLGRACTEAEKADVLAWLLTLKTGG